MLTIGSLTALNFSISRLAAVPDDLPHPPIQMASGPVMQIRLHDLLGNEQQPEKASLRIRVDDAWLAACPATTCQPVVHHFHDGDWTILDAGRWNTTDGTVLLVETESFSVFAVGGIPIEGEGLTSLAPLDAGIGLWWLLGAVAIVAVPASAYAVRTRRSKLDDEKVQELLSHASDKEELLQFINTTAHDLANPLTPIQLQLDMLEMAADESDPEKRREAIGSVKANVDQLTLLVSDLRDAAKLRSGQLRMYPEPHDLGDLLREAVKARKEQAEAAGVRFGLEAIEGLEVHVDKGRIMQVLNNFLSNALKFTDAGGSVSIETEARGGLVRVAVKDTGVGMTAEDQAKLFQPFSQGHGDKEKAKGTGLGLFIAKGIVEAHDGEIGCRSGGPGQGSMFWFTLPTNV